VFFGIDPLYFLILAPAMLLSAWAAWATHARFAEWSQVRNGRGITGAQVARYLLDRFGLPNVRVVPSRGALSDHYDPRAREVRLSEPVFYEESVAALAVAAHEVGHAIQHRDRYAPLVLRNLAVPLASLGSNLSFLVIFAGFLLSMTELVWAGVILFGGVVFFQIITLPVELDASARAKRALVELGLVTSPREQAGVASVLGAAAMTYVGAALSSALTLLYYLIRLGVFSDARDRR
jgi:Zn-dependent membrane protease YugP